MGKKKDERKRRERDAEQAASRVSDAAREGRKHADRKHADRKHADGKHDGGAPLAGIAAAVAKQLGTPAGRQMVAAGLMMAATAISRQDTKTAVRTAPPEPSVTPDTATSEADAKPSTDGAAANPYAGNTAEPPRGEAPPVSPEIAKVIGAVTSGLEGLFAGFGKPRNGPPKV